MSEQSELDKAVPGADDFLSELGDFILIDRLTACYPEQLAEYRRQAAEAGITKLNFVGVPNDDPAFDPGFTVSSFSGTPEAYFFYNQKRVWGDIAQSGE